MKTTMLKNKQQKTKKKIHEKWKEATTTRTTQCYCWPEAEEEAGRVRE